MALSVRFWSGFAKRENSTQMPVGTPTYTMSCELKSETGILNPILEIGMPMTFNPRSLNYAAIDEFLRFYFVTDWTWSGGLWLCSLRVDVLATYKTEIGSSTKYVVRSAAEENTGIVDTLYPSMFGPRQTYTDQINLGWARSFTDAAAAFVLGVESNSFGSSSTASNAGPIKYWVMSVGQLISLVNYILDPYSDPDNPGSLDWHDLPQDLTELTYRTLYDPFSYIKSCKFFPYIDGTAWGVLYPYIGFGNYLASVPLISQWAGLRNDATTWPYQSVRLDLPTGWNLRRAREMTSPYTRMYLTLNPWGIIELNPSDFARAIKIEVEIFPDYISGDCLLKIYAVYASDPRALISQSSAKIGLDIPLTATMSKGDGLISGASAVAAGLSAVAGASGVGAAVAGTLTAAGGALSAASALSPTPGLSVGGLPGGLRAMDGLITLSVWDTQFADEDISEYGRPLYRLRRLDTLSGYIKCGDGDISINGYDDERRQISEYLTGGFFYA